MSIRVFDALSRHAPEALSSYGIRPNDLRSIENFGPQDSVFLVGSYARGEATASSDLDLAVLCDRQPARVDGTRGYPSVVGDTVVAAEVNGLALTVEFIRRSVLRGISEVLAAIPGTSESPSLGNLGALELRAVERIGTGIVLQQGAGDAELIEGLDLSKARLNKAALAFLISMGHLRAATAPGADRGIRSLRLREGAQDLLIAEVNAAGVLTFDSKHLVRRATLLTTGHARRLLDGLSRLETEPNELESRLRAAADEFVARASQERQRALINVLLRPIMPRIETAWSSAA
ncbi:nucleotidyltransferase domain-containing protein [Streptomyces griseus]|uniref:nucleotidyltransferase domain-containing protein n=1 Tax=Streptomyces griseus TaxID=1911 RepID=UPI0004C88FBE|nr:nucleotidyltransferase domain-containing protein [Streptomyces griseus]